MRGSTVPDWDNATEHEVTRIMVTKRDAVVSSDRDGRALQVTDKRTLRAMYDADIREGDRVRWDGRMYEVDGEVVKTPSPTGRVSSTRATLARWEG